MSGTTRTRMRTAVVFALGAALLGAGLSSTKAEAATSNLPVRVTHVDPTLHGEVLPRGAAKPTNAGNTSNMTSHGGRILTTTTVQPIFWGTTWPTDTSDKVSGINTFYAGHSNSGYAKTSNEYTGTNGQVTATHATKAAVIDGTSSASANSSSALVNEVAKLINAGTIKLYADGYYPVYTDIPRGSAGYCAWHSSGAVSTTVSGVTTSTPITVAFFFRLDGDAGCDPQSTVVGVSQGLAAIVNVSAHELEETRTDPYNGGWWDSKGAENADKCAWLFDANPVTLTNGSQWKLQSEWSNAAYTKNLGSPRGCISTA